MACDKRWTLNYQMAVTTVSNVHEIRNREDNISWYSSILKPSYQNILYGSDHGFDPRSSVIIQLKTGCEGSSKFIVPRNTNYFPTRSGGKYFVLRGTINLLLPKITGF